MPFNIRHYLSAATLVLVLAALPIGTAAAAPSDPTSAARFSITIDGHEIASFSDADFGAFVPDAPEAELKKLPGKQAPPTVVLKRGTNFSMELQRWQAGGAQ